MDSTKIQQIGEYFGVGKYSRYFPVIFTGRTIDRYLYTPLLNKLIAPKDFEATETNCKMDLECNVQ